MSAFMSAPPDSSNNNKSNNRQRILTNKISDSCNQFWPQILAKDRGAQNEEDDEEEEAAVALGQAWLAVSLTRWHNLLIRPRYSLYYIL